MYKLLTSILALAALAAQAQDYKPAPVSLSTKWGRAVSPDNVWQQHPRPQMQRADWQHLNGLWNYSVQKKAQESRLNMRV
ncbi:hypothetical protein LWM68_39890 [Niabella sp. W65]|nr:hypothetical protein [Niabella sp. W65]MCH7368358.1 hypothetical protein [Niabella sp. W65]ULT43954.1 hypothetical protein KRR40_11555 [Niabella sp. I65]